MKRMVLLASVVVVLFAGEALAQRGWTTKDATVYAKLEDTIVSFTFSDQPLTEAIDFLQTLGGVNIVVDRKKVEEGKNVTLKLNNVPLSTALKLVTEQAELKWVVRDGVVLISDEEGTKQEPVTVVYPVDDLLAIPPDFEGPTMELQNINQQNSGTGSGTGGSSGSSIFGDGEDNPEDEVMKDREELLQELVDLIKAVIEPGTWDEGG
ncbi:MAG TPA: STN domain-containing protein [Planctomycetota bacterium]|nr:STN domain-containing protein [Planctomycetota bacterium]